MAVFPSVYARFAACTSGAFHRSHGGGRSSFAANRLNASQLNIQRHIKSDGRLRLIWTSEESAALRNPPD